MAEDRVYTVSQRGIGLAFVGLLVLAAIPGAYFYGKKAALEPDTCACGEACECGPRLPVLPRRRPHRPDGAVQPDLGAVAKEQK